MSRSTCWSCNESIGSSYNYCGDCGAPIAEFQKRAGDGFLSRESTYYLTAVLNDTIEFPKDASLNDGLQDSLHEQLQEDIRRGFVDLAAVCAVSNDLIFKGIEFEPYLEWEEEELLAGELPPSLIGFTRLLESIASVFPPDVLEIFRDGDEEVETG